MKRKSCKIFNTIPLDKVLKAFAGFKLNYNKMDLLSLMVISIYSFSHKVFQSCLPTVVKSRDCVVKTSDGRTVDAFLFVLTPKKYDASLHLFCKMFTALLFVKPTTCFLFIQIEREN